MRRRHHCRHRARFSFCVFRFSIWPCHRVCPKPQLARFPKAPCVAIRRTVETRPVASNQEVLEVTGQRSRGHRLQTNAMGLRDQPQVAFAPSRGFEIAVAVHPLTQGRTLPHIQHPAKVAQEKVHARGFRHLLKPRRPNPCVERTEGFGCVGQKPQLLGRQDAKAQRTKRGNASFWRAPDFDRTSEGMFGCCGLSLSLF